MTAILTFLFFATLYYLVLVLLSKTLIPSPIKETKLEITIFGIIFIACFAGFIVAGTFLRKYINNELLYFTLLILLLFIYRAKDYLVKPYIYALCRKKTIDQTYIQFAHEQGCKTKVITVPKLINAVAMGITSGTHCIVIGEELRTRMTTEELNGVVSHEIAHLKLGHIKMLLLFSVITSLLYMGLFLLIARHYTMNAEIAGLTAGFCALISLIVTSFPVRYNEKQADLYAARMVGKETYISALKKLNEATNKRMDKFDWDHPLLKTRIQYIERFVD